MKTYFLTVQLGAEVKNWLLGDFYELAKRDSDFKLVVFAYLEEIEAYRKQFGHERCIFEPIKKLPTGTLKQIFRTASYITIPSDTIRGRTKYRYLEGGSLLSYWIKRLIWILSFTKIWRSLTRIAEHIFFHDEGVWKDYFDRYEPNAVFAPTTYREVDMTMLKYAKKVGVPSLGMLRGWDNMSSKAFILVHPDLLLAQNPLMKDEAVRWNDFVENQVKVIGFPYFDHYFDPKWQMSREEVAEAVGIDPKKKWIAYLAGGMMTGFLNDSKNSDHIFILKEDVEREEYGDSDVVVSVHPSNRAMIPEESLGDRVRVLRLVKGWTFTLDTVKTIMNFVRHSDIVVDTGSSLALEAAIFDKPVIFVGFNGYKDNELPSHRILSRVYAYTVHLQYFIRTGGVWVVKDREELKYAIKTYLNDPSLHREGRTRIVREVVGPLDGKAGERAYRALVELGRHAKIR